MGFACINIEGPGLRRRAYVDGGTGTGAWPRQSWTVLDLSHHVRIHCGITSLSSHFPVLPSVLETHFLKILSYRVWRRTGLTVAGDCYP